MYLIKCYSMLQNARVPAFTVFELLRENQHWGGGGWEKIPPLPRQPRLRLIIIEITIAIIKSIILIVVIVGIILIILKTKIILLLIMIIIILKIIILLIQGQTSIERET